MRKLAIATISVAFVLATTACALELLFVAPVSAALISTDTAAGSSAAIVRTRLNATYGKLPMQFEENCSQTDERVRFLSRGTSYTLFLTATEAVLSLRRQPRSEATQVFQSHGAGTNEQKTTEFAVLRLAMLGSNTSAEVDGLDELPGKANYFVGNDPAKWLTGIRTYSKVRYTGIYPGIDLVYYGNQRRLEFDFVLSPGADPDLIRFSVEGVEDARLDEDGNLTVPTEVGDVVLRAPIVSQNVDGARRQLAAGFVLGSGKQISFRVAEYDRSKPLVIDPVLAYSTYLGGMGGDYGWDIAVDSSGNAYVTGLTHSSDFPTANPLQGTIASAPDGFVTKFDSAGSALIYSTYLGGSSVDQGRAIAVDAAGNAYVTGNTESNDFPRKNPIQSTRKGGDDAFVTKLNAAGSALVYSTYLGGNYSDEGFAIAVDGSGNAYVTGATQSTNFPVFHAVQSSSGGFYDAFITKLNAAGSAFVYSTYLGGTELDDGNGIAVDSAGNAYVTGRTNSANFPTLNPIQATYGGGSGYSGGDLFVTKLDATGSALVYSTYLGGTSTDEGKSIDVTGAGEAVVTGESISSTTFPTMNPIQAASAGGKDAIVAKLNAAGSALVFSTYLGGSASEGYVVGALDRAGNIYVVGNTISADYPLVDPIQGSIAGGPDVFVTKLNSTGDTISYSTFLGGSQNENPWGVATDHTGGIYVAGYTDSTDFPMANALQAVYAGGIYDVFAFKLQTECQTDPDCDDGNPCTDDVCNPSDPEANVAGCVYTDNENSCNDGDACTTDDMCIGGTCVGGPALDCDDGEVCTDDSCDPGEGCVYSYNRPGCLDHFLCYKTKQARQEIPDVTLSDQFDADAVHEVQKGRVFCVPADKNGEGIVDLDTHLMGYKIKGPHVPRWSIKVTNQFGTLVFDTKKADVLMVPTGESRLPDPPPGPPDPGSLVDHYRCLKVKTTRFTAKFPTALKKVPVPVVDQFQSRSVYLKKPVKLCLPVDKNGEGIKNPEPHLLCYKVKADPSFATTGVQTTNQFGQVTLDLKKEAELCVPSVKILPTATITLP